MALFDQINVDTENTLKDGVLEKLSFRQKDGNTFTTNVFLSDGGGRTIIADVFEQGFELEKISENKFIYKKKETVKVN